MTRNLGAYAHASLPMRIAACAATVRITAALLVALPVTPLFISRFPCGRAHGIAGCGVAIRVLRKSETAKAQNENQGYCNSEFLAHV